MTFLDLSQYIWSEENSNAFAEEDDLIAEFFLAGVDKVPPYGLFKKIEVSFDRLLVFPQINLCELTISLVTFQEKLST